MSEEWQELATQKIDHWEPVESSDGKRGKAWVYYKDGKTFAGYPVWLDGDLEDILCEIVEWQKVVFPQATSKSRATHLLREAAELYVNPGDGEEMADMLFLLAGLAAGEGVDLADACRKKLEINKARQWGKPDDSGVVEHI